MAKSQDIFQLTALLLCTFLKPLLYTLLKHLIHLFLFLYLCFVLFILLFIPAALFTPLIFPSSPPLILFDQSDYSPLCLSVSLSLSHPFFCFPGRLRGE